MTLSISNIRVSPRMYNTEEIEITACMHDDVYTSLPMKMELVDIVEKIDNGVALSIKNTTIRIGMNTYKLDELYENIPNGKYKELDKLVDKLRFLDVASQLK